MQNLCDGVFSLQLRRNRSSQKRGFGTGPQRPGSEDPSVSGVRDRQAEVGKDTSFAHHRACLGCSWGPGTLGSQCRSEAPPHFAVLTSWKATRSPRDEESHQALPLPFSFKGSGQRPGSVGEKRKPEQRCFITGRPSC